MKRTVHAANERLLESLLDSDFTSEKHINAYEKRAIEIGDLDRAIKYNWLRNAYKQGHITEDQVFFKLLQIHADQQESSKYVR